VANKNRTKGHNAERQYRNEFVELGYEYCVTSRYGSRQHDDCGIDLINLPFNVQIKAGYARGLNYSKVLRNVKEMVSINFPDDAKEHTNPTFIIHKKDVGKGRKTTEFDELVVMTKEDFLKLIT